MKEIPDVKALIDQTLQGILFSRNKKTDEINGVYFTFDSHRLIVRLDPENNFIVALDPE